MIDDMPGCLIDIEILLDCFQNGLMTESQLSYALGICGPGMTLGKIIWQMKCLFNVNLPRQTFYSFIP